MNGHPGASQGRIQRHGGRQLHGDANETMPTIPPGTVTVSGTPVVGQTLTASNSLADADGLGAITYQWYRDGVPIVLGVPYKMETEV